MLLGLSSLTHQERSFVERAKQCLEDTAKRDRLSLLSSSDSDGRGRRVLSLQRKHVSPRNAIPEDCKLTLSPAGRPNVYTVQLYRLKDNAWKKISIANTKHKGSELEDGPAVDVLTNITQQLRCAVVAFEGASSLYQTSTALCKKEDISDERIAIEFVPVLPTGELDRREPRSLAGIGCIGSSILGINENQRLTLLTKHVCTSQNKLMFPSLSQYIGAGESKLLVRDVYVSPPASIRQLNEEQLKVAHPLHLRTAREVAGPPGTGKTKTITELMRSILECTEYDVIILSERNGAIDAIAEKVGGDCLAFNIARENQSVTNLDIWSKFIAFGSSSVGPSTALFMLEKKLEYHPEIIRLSLKLEALMAVQQKHRKALLVMVAEAVALVEAKHPSLLDPRKTRRSVLIRTMADTAAPFSSPLATCGVILSTLKAVVESLSRLTKRPSDELQELEVENAMSNFDDLIGNLIPNRDERAKKQTPWSHLRRQVHDASSMIAKSLQSVLDKKLCSEKEVAAISRDEQRAKHELEDAHEELMESLVTDARVFVCTIGSSHRLQEAISRGKPTVVIFDEAGCIPSFELLGLSRLERDIVSLVCVGDKKQLAPYNPGATFTKSFKEQKSDNIPSLLDVSAMTIESGSKVVLTKQYRVPRDIADILNARVYGGKYLTAPGCTAPLRGFTFVSVDSPTRAYEDRFVNENEIQECIRLVKKSLMCGQSNIMVLTPYKKQQRQLEFRFKRHFDHTFLILTIDQCQGQEADVVIISMVQRPTKFLTLNRFNVALSRVRKQLYLLADRNDFRLAATDTSWECQAIARDLLAMAHRGYESDSSDDESYGGW